MSEVFITGLGIISAVGNGIGETLYALKNGISGIGKLNLLNTIHKDHLSVGEVKLTDEELNNLAGLGSDLHFSRTSLLGILAAKQAFKVSDGNQKFRTGLISATSVGGMGTTENFFRDIIRFDENIHPTWQMDVLEAGDSTERIADYLGIRDFLTTINTACSSSANAIMLGARMIKSGQLDRVLVGGADSLTKFSINGFLTLQNVDSQPCKPFDENRNGLNLGEGAGYLLLESEKAIEGKEILGLVTGYGNANDAFHQTSSSPNGEGAFLAMQKALKISNLAPEKIDYINAHGTATEINDLSEGIAMERIFGDVVPAFSSTKSFTGHTLAAAGGIEAVVSILAMQNGLIFPGLNCKQPMPEFKFRQKTKLLENQQINHVMSNSFGFGGNTTSILFSRC